MKLLKRINSKYPSKKTYKDFHLSAVDGSDICIDTDASDVDTLLFDVGKPANLFHINVSLVTISDNPNVGSNGSDNILSHIHQEKHNYNDNGSFLYCRMFRYIQTPGHMRV